MDTETEVKKTIGIRLDTTTEQENEFKLLFDAFKIGINWSLNEIEKRYQAFLSYFDKIEKTEGQCTNCKKEKALHYEHDGQKYCVSCAMKHYSEYTVRKEVYGTGVRTVENDMKDVVFIPNKTHYTMLFSQAYSMWKSFNTWRNKRLYEKQRLEEELQNYPDPIILDAAWGIEHKSKDIKRDNPKLIWKTAKALATKEIFRVFSEKEQKEITRIHDKIMDLRKVSRPIHFPQLKECRTVMMSAGFVSIENEIISMTMWEKKSKQIAYFGKEYLKQYFPAMEEDSVYCNITKKNDQYYLMYPMSIKVRQPPDIKECDAFVFMTSPGKTAILGYDKDGVLNSTRFWNTGVLKNAKLHFKDKRSEIVTRKSPEEKMRQIRRRRKNILCRGDIEQRFVSTYNHQLTRKMIDYVMEQSENPKILIWDVGNGITQNFGKHLNFLKNLWVAVQQQEYLKHKAMQLSIPIVEIKYNLCNDLTCSACGAKQANGKKAAKVITQFIKGIKNFKCEKCGYEVNMLINQGNNVASV